MKRKVASNGYAGEGGMNRPARSGDDMRSTYLLSLLATAASVGLTAPAFAAAADANAGGVAVEEIVVTANKRVETAHNVPMAISAVSQERLERTQATSLNDFVNQIPGVTYTSNSQGAGTLTLRGINAGGVAATVGTYVDETPYGSSTALVNASVLAVDINPFDMSRVEVLKGPQGTLYGAGALGGVIKYVTNAPDPSQRSARVEAGARTVAHGETGWNLDGMINLPLNDRIAVRATGYYEDRPGFIDDPIRNRDDINYSHVYGGRISGLANVTDTLSVRLTANLQNIRSGAPGAIDIFAPTTASDFRPVFGRYQATDAIPSSLSPQLRINYRLYNATVNWDLGFAKLVSATSYSTLKFLQYQDFSGFSNLGDILSNSVHQDKVTEEIRLTSPDEGRIQWQVGFYHTRETGDIRQILTKIASPTSVDLDQGLPSIYQEDAIFGELTFKFTDTFDVTVGGRRAHDKQSGGQFGQAFGSPFAISNKASENATTFSFAPRWRPTSSTTVYGRIASGYLAGGPNVIDVINAPSGVPGEFGPEKLINYEAGLKQYLLDGRLALDLNVYHIDWKKIQLLGVVNGVAITTNGGKAVSNGFEWSVTYNPIQGLTLTWDGAISRAHLTEDTPAIVGAKDGDRLPHSPHFNTTLGGDYEWPAFGDYTAFAGATWQHVDDQGAGFVTGFPFRQFVLPSYDVVNLRAGIKRDQLRIQVFANNLGNDKGYTDVGTHFTTAGGAGPPLGGYFAGVITPRTFGVSVSQGF
jgi:outer membrane receptor protein involved in Fe transport